MRKLPHLIAFGAIIVFISICLFVSCRKAVQNSGNVQPIETKTPDNFTVSENADNIIKLLAAKFSKQNDESRFIESLVAVAGNPYWDKAIITGKMKPN